MKTLDAGLSQEKLKQLFAQGLEDFVGEYNERVEFRAKWGFGYENHWGAIPEKVTIGESTYTPQELLEHFKKGDNIGSQILKIMSEYFMKSASAGIAAFGLMGKFDELKDKESDIKVYDDKGEVDQNQMLDAMHSLDLKVNPILGMAVYNAVKILYFTPEQIKNEII